MPRIDDLLREYGAHHRTRGNVACHFAGVPLILFGLLAMLGSLRIADPGGASVTGAEVLILLGTIYYLVLDVRFAFAMLAVSAALDILGRAAGWKAGLAAFVIGWIIQGVGHAVFEKRSPAFLRNFVHLLVGPVFLLNEMFHLRRVDSSERPDGRGHGAGAVRATLRLVAFGLLVLLGAYLVAWPVPVRPVAWRPPKAPPLTGPYAPNDHLRGIEYVGRGVALGPESTAIDGEGRVVFGTSDGRILRLDPRLGPAGTSLVQIAQTGGRPLGMAFEHSGRLLICDAMKGLLALSLSGDLRTLATQCGGVPFGFTNDVDVAPDGTVYFTDTSSRFGIKQVREIVMEHGGGGRLMAYHPESGKVDLLLSDLQFANGVAVADDGASVLVCETGAYRVTRYWLAGPERGTSEPFIENLPGLPDNITWSAQRRAFWIALYSPRVPALDLLAGRPFLRRVVLRLPQWIQPQPARHAWALAVDEGGAVVENLQYGAPDSFSPVTSVRERDGILWLGSLERDALGKIGAPPIASSR